MTLKCFCMECGTPNYYVDKKPSFCSSCATPFGTAKAKQKVQAKKPKYVEPEEEEYEEEEESVDIPIINKLKIKAQETERSGVKFDDVWGTKVPGQNDDDFKRAPIKSTAKDILNRGGNTGKSITIGGEGSDDE